MKGVEVSSARMLTKTVNLKSGMSADLLVRI
jgi:hypothetical protein